MNDQAPHDAHVVKANEVFRSCGFTLAAMEYPRCPDALNALKRFNGLPDSAAVPFAWRFHPNAWCRDNWRANLGVAA